jgi:hypothetical protein
VDPGRTGHGFRDGMSDDELYTSVRGIWVLSPETARRYPYALAVHGSKTPWRPGNRPRLVAPVQRSERTGGPGRVDSSRADQRSRLSSDPRVAKFRKGSRTVATCLGAER